MGAEVLNVPPVLTRLQDIPKLEIAQDNYGRTLKANPFDDKSDDGIVYRVELLDDSLLDSFPAPPPQEKVLVKRKLLFFLMIGGTFPCQHRHRSSSRTIQKHQVDIITVSRPRRRNVQRAGVHPSAIHGRQSFYALQSREPQGELAATYYSLSPKSKQNQTEAN